jgi:hypothetical protein
MIFAWILLLASSTLVDVVDEVYQIPANDWRYVEVGLKQKAAVVHAHYTVESGQPKVRLALLRSEDLERLRAGMPHGIVDETEPGGSGAFVPHARGPGDFVVVVVNEGDVPAKVRMRIWLDFGAFSETQVTLLSPRRQFTVILLSFATFFGIVTWSARRLLRGIRR